MKLDKNTVAKRYSKALFELATEQEKVEAVYADLLQLRHIFNDVPGLENILSDSRLNLAEKRAIMDNLLEGFDGIVANALEIIFQYGRMYDIYLIIDEFEKRYDVARGILEVEVTTAVNLPEEQKERLTNAVAQKFGYQTATLSEHVDPAIIGGVIVESNYQIIDGSIKKRLENLRKNLSR